MRKPLCLLALVPLLFMVRASRAQDPATVAASQRIIDQEKQSSELMANLEYLCDTIGPRLTGSDRLRKANEWVAEKMRAYGLENVHQESWTIPQGWERGRCDVEMLEPRAQPIEAAAAAWTPGTRGTVTGPVVYLSAQTDEELATYKGKLRNAVVLFSQPAGVNEHPSMTPAGGRGTFGGTDEQPEPQQPGQQPAAAPPGWTAPAEAARPERTGGLPAARGRGRRAD